MERLGKRILVIAIGILLSISTLRPADQNKLTKVFHHTNDDAKSTNIELGTLFFYFDREPVYRVVPNQAKDKLVFEFSDIAPDSAETAAMIKKVNSSKAPHYSITIERAKAPVNGLRVVMKFNPDLIGVTIDHSPSIRMEKGVIFHLHNKELLKTIKASAQKPVLSIAAASKPTVVIDCGHGGSDAGAIGCALIKEKEVLLPIGLEVARLLEQEGVGAILTRSTDCTVGLDERTTLANTHHADAFISIHANSAPNAHVRGIETFCVDPKNFQGKYASLTPEEKKIADGFFLNRCAQAQLLADALHGKLLAEISQKKYPVVDRKVKHASSQVLVGAHMPAVLVEIGFVTHESESRLLKSPKYQQVVAQGISNGILAFLHANNA